MRKNLRYFFLPSLMLLTQLAIGQTERFAYAITDVNKEGVNWSVLRKLDLQNGSFSDVLLNGSDATPLAYDAATKKQLATPLTDARFGNLVNAAFGTGVAAIAFDKKNNRLYFTPMLYDQLRYVDLKTMKVYFVSSDFTTLKVKAADQSNIITRMTIASDGNGYALTNDGNNLIRFSTGKKSAIIDLGTLVDAPENNGVSIHNSCSSYGGDMIADDDDNLYVFSARNHVFKINIATKVATHLGTVNGLPASFTINGAAVDNSNQVLVTSAMDISSLYTIDIKTWTATPLASAVPWRSSDLANSNLLSVRVIKPLPELLKAPETALNNKIQLYPNPVSDNQFAIQFNQQESGNYTIQVLDAVGKQSSAQNIVTVNGKNQTETVRLSPASKKGVYLVKVTNQNNKLVFSKKILVQ